LPDIIVYLFVPFWMIITLAYSIHNNPSIVVYFAGFHELNDEMNVVLKIPSVLLRHVFIMFEYCMTSTKHGST
jgi:hypothetical protein